jgi:hypothetical protein
MNNLDINFNKSENFSEFSYPESRNSNSSIFSVVSKIFQEIGQFFSSIFSSIANFFFVDSNRYAFEPSAPVYNEFGKKMPLEAFDVRLADGWI